MARVVGALLSLGLCFHSASADTTISRDEYFDKLRGFWLGVNIANWTGLQTENRHIDFPFFTNEDFGPEKIDFTVDPDPWAADDDSNIEYVYQYAIEQYGTYRLTGEQISGEYGQYCVKIFSTTDLEPGNHTLRIECDGTEREKTIDMISVM